MSKMTYQEILEKLQEEYVEVSEFAYDGDGEVKGVGEMKEIARHGGEDQGSNWYSVKHFPDHDVYIKVTGYYSSYHGTDFDGGWDDCEEVKPKEKVITVFE